MNSRTISILIVLAASWPLATVAEVNGTNLGYLVDPKFDVVTTLNTGLCVRTSDWTPARAAAAAACSLCAPDLCPHPQPVAAAVPTPPPPAPPAAAPSPQQPKPAVPRIVNFSADTLFDFDRFTLKPEGKTLLDNLARELSGATYGLVIAIGHTDRLGSAVYNQKLSERRAGAVRDYLIAQGVPSNLIRAEGKGKTQPLTKPGECRNLPRAKLIACLQIDRRVDIDVH